ncbi:PIN domain-containing protein [Streptomyces sp. NPDC058440]|uniref:PIN domain-containing protein n=1 Tax=Streptomyces sp. NPDC058440 TaxID=3346501 RepID=UPI0036579A3E
MIIFDTNAVHLLQPETLRADIIRKLRQSRHHRVAVPWMVLEEMAAHQARSYPSKYDKVTEALATLRGLVPWELTNSLEPLDMERFLDHWRGIYAEIFEVIETSDTALRKGYQREAQALPPAKRSRELSVGGRDVAIWFSILEFLEQNPEEHVHFVTNNTSDFGDGTSYPYPMNEDIRGLEGRLTLLKDFEQVVSQFTKEVSGEAAATQAEALLRSPRIRSLVAQTAARLLASATGYQGLDNSGGVAVWSSWLAAPEIDLLSVTDVTGHQIEGDVWYTAKATWLLYGTAFTGDGDSLLDVAVVWDTKVLFSTDDDGEAKPTLLTEEPPTPPDTADDSRMEVLRRLKERAARAARKATDTLGDARTTAAAAALAYGDAASKTARLVINPSLLEMQKAVTASLPTLDIANAVAKQTASLISPTQQTIGRQISAQIAAAMPHLDIVSKAAAQITPPLIDPAVLAAFRQVRSTPLYESTPAPRPIRATDEAPAAEEDDDAGEEKADD